MGTALAESEQISMHRLFERPTTAIELGDSIAGSYCGRLLLLLGAHVVKAVAPEGPPRQFAPPFVTMPSGEALSATYAALNFGKATLRADIDSQEGQQVVEEALIERGDLVLMSGTTAEWGARNLAPARISSLVPRAVIGRITSFGDDGPYATIVGGELQAQALGGLMNMVGQPPREPLRLGGYQVQYATGLALLSGFALAMFRRENTGLGASFATSVIETVAQIEWKQALSYQASGAITSRGSEGAPAILRAKDGFFALFYRPADWPKVVAIMGDQRLEAEEFATQDQRDSNRDALLAVLNECTSRMSKRELYHRTQAMRMTTGYMATMGDLLSSEQYIARGFFDVIDLGEGVVGALPGAPWRLVAEDTGSSERQ